MRLPHFETGDRERDSAVFLDENIAELTLIFSVEEISTLERIAGVGGLTIGQWIRQVLASYLDKLEEPIAVRSSLWGYTSLMENDHGH